jgi:hypothetical protein
MALAVVLKLQSHAATAVIVRGRGARITVDSVVRVSLEGVADPRAVGEKIAAALEGLGLGRAATTVAVPRTDLNWQNYDLPPAPAAEVPSLVHMQAQRDLALADDGVGFDYLSLHGNEEHPHHVLGVGLTPPQLDRIRQICTAADLKLERIVPEPFGWFELSRRIGHDDAGDSPMTVYSAIAGLQAAAWAVEGDALRLVRTIWLSAEGDPQDDVAALAGELRRTLMSVAQLANAPASSLRCVYCGERADEVAGLLSAALSRPVRAVPLEQTVAVPSSEQAALAELTPLAVVGAVAAEGRPPAMDLLHPHRPPAPPSRRRTYILAGLAAASLVLLVAAMAYRRLQAPLAAAAADDAQREALADQLEAYAEDETQAAAIDGWLGESLNLLTELDHLSRQLRPQPLDAADFNADQDVVLTRLSLTLRQLALAAAVKSTEAVLPVETRLREGDYHAERGPMEPQTEGVPGYVVSVATVLERVDESAADGAEAAP